MTVSIDQAQLRLAELIRDAQPGETIEIEQRGTVVAELMVKQSSERRPEPGILKGKIRIICDDDDHLADFKEYME